MPFEKLSQALGGTTTPGLEIWQVHPISKHPTSGRLSFPCCDKQTKLTSNKEKHNKSQVGQLAIKLVSFLGWFVVVTVACF